MWRPQPPLRASQNVLLSRWGLVRNNMKTTLCFVLSVVTRLMFDHCFNTEHLVWKKHWENCTLYLDRSTTKISAKKSTKSEQICDLHGKCQPIIISVCNKIIRSLDQCKWQLALFLDLIFSFSIVGQWRRHRRGTRGGMECHCFIFLPFISNI